MRSLHVSIQFVLIILFSASLAGGGPRRGPRETPLREQAEGDFGLGFHDPTVNESVALLADGRADEAVDKLKAAIKDSPNSNELKLGLAMVQIRAGQGAKTHQMLKKLAKSNDDATTALRARVLLRAAAQRRPVPRKGETTKPLATEEGWRSSLTKVAEEISQSVQKKHAALFGAVNKEQWSAIESNLAAVREDVSTAGVITLPDAAPVASKHLDLLVREIEQVNTQVNRLIHIADDKRANLRQGGGQYKGRRKRLQEQSSPAGKAEYNQLCDEIRHAVDAGNLLIDEYRSVRDRTGISVKGKVAIRLPRHLPQPIP